MSRHTLANAPSLVVLYNRLVVPDSVDRICRPLERSANVGHSEAIAVQVCDLELHDIRVVHVGVCILVQGQPPLRPSTTFLSFQIASVAPSVLCICGARSPSLMLLWPASTAPLIDGILASHHITDIGRPSAQHVECMRRNMDKRRAKS